MKNLIAISFLLILTSNIFACSICESKCPYEQARAEQEFRFRYEYREVIIYNGYIEEQRLRQQLRNRRRQNILNYSSNYGGRYSLNRPYYNHRYGSYKGGSYLH